MLGRDWWQASAVYILEMAANTLCQCALGVNVRADMCNVRADMRSPEDLGAAQQLLADDFERLGLPCRERCAGSLYQPGAKQRQRLGDICSFRGCLLDANPCNLEMQCDNQTKTGRV